MITNDYKRILIDYNHLTTESAVFHAVTLHHQIKCLTHKKFTTMEATVNRVEIQGFLGRDAEVRTFDSGRTLVTFSVATNENYKNAKGEWITNTTWHNITYWKNRKDESVDFLKKGELIAVNGKLNTRKYTDKEGKDRYITDIIAMKVEPTEVKVGM
jgi:single-strand DNA-binding protein